MAKQAEPEKGKQEMVSEAVAILGGGKASSVKAVSEWLEKHYPKVKFPSIQGQVSKARKDLGFGRGSAKPAKAAKTEKTESGDRGEPTLSDLRGAKELCDKLQMNPTQLVELVGEITEYGDPATLEKCLTALVDITTAKK